MEAGARADPVAASLVCEVLRSTGGGASSLAAADWSGGVLGERRRGRCGRR
jgi:hypothetical protein